MFIISHFDELKCVCSIWDLQKIVYRANVLVFDLPLCLGIYLILFLLIQCFSSERIQFVCGPKGIEQLVHHNYLYRKNYQKELKTYWRCALYETGKCRCRIITTEDGFIYSKNLSHTHPPDMKLIEAKIFMYERIFRNIQFNTIS